jgi:hypothetical protein
LSSLRSVSDEGSLKKYRFFTSFRMTGIFVP